jgi:hypothetical protein
MESYLCSILRKFECNALADTSRPSGNDGHFPAKATTVFVAHCVGREKSSKKNQNLR